MSGVPTKVRFDTPLSTMYRRYRVYSTEYILCAENNDCHVGKVSIVLAGNNTAREGSPRPTTNDAAPTRTQRRPILRRDRRRACCAPVATVVVVVVVVVIVFVVFSSAAAIRHQARVRRHDVPRIPIPTPPQHRAGSDREPSVRAPPTSGQDRGLGTDGYRRSRGGCGGVGRSARG